MLYVQLILTWYFCKTLIFYEMEDSKVKDIKKIFQFDDKAKAEEVQRILEEKGIYCLINSENPASSFLHLYFGVAIRDVFTVFVDEEDFDSAHMFLEEHGYMGVPV